MLERSVPVIPAEPGSVLMKTREDEAVDTKIQSAYWCGKAHSHDEMVMARCVECASGF